MDDTGAAAEAAVGRALQAWYRKARDRHTDPAASEDERDQVMASKVGVSPDLVKSWKYGRRWPQYDHIARIAALDGRSIVAAWNEVGAELAQQWDQRPVPAEPGATSRVARPWSSGR